MTITADTWARWLEHPLDGDVPPPPRSFAAVCKLLLDDATVGAMRLVAPPFWISPDRVDTDVRDELDRILDLHRARGWDLDPVAFHRSPAAIVDIEAAPASSWAGGFEHLRFASDYEPDRDDPTRARWMGNVANRTAHAWVVRGRPDAPWVICVHAFAMGAPWLDLGAFRAHHLHAAHGVNVLSYVLPLHGPRLGGESTFAAFLGGPGTMIQLMAHAIWDLRGIIAWLRHEGTPWIGVQGLSLGAYTVALLAAIDPDLAFVVAGIPAVDLEELVRTRRGAEGEHLEPFWADTRQALRVISPMALPPRIPRERRYIFAGLVDRMSTPRSVRALWLHWDRPRIEWFPGSHTSFFFERPPTTLVEEGIRQAEAGRHTTTPRGTR